MIVTLIGIFLLGILVIAALIVESGRWNSKDIAVLSVLTSFAVLGRLPFAAIPGFQFTTFFVIISGLHLGSRAGMSCGFAAALVTNFFLGHGPWTPWQMMAWGCCGLLAGVFKKLIPSPTRWGMAFLGVACAFFAALLLNFYSWLFYYSPLSLQTFIAANILSFPYDAAHAITNAVLLFTLAPSILRLLENFSQKK
ncbi:MAG: ECF transporter S component [Chthoniobacterales bacterium]|nr:ECF transporter S component [Chthoniobacterales bacterium]